MAFTSRAQRSSDHLTMGNTPTSVGPGSYGAYFNHVSLAHPPPRAYSYSFTPLSFSIDWEAF